MASARAARRNDVAPILTVDHDVSLDGGRGAAIVDISIILENIEVILISDTKEIWTNSHPREIREVIVYFGENWRHRWCRSAGENGFSHCKPFALG